MTLEHSPLRRDEAAEARAAARRQSKGIERALAFVPGIAVAFLLMTVLVMLDYTFDQDPHRIVKVALGALALGTIVAVPKFGLLVLPVATPFLPWVPPTPIPGLNPLNILLMSVFGTFAIGRLLQHKPLFRANHLGSLLGVILLLCAVSVIRGAAFPTGFGYDARDAAMQLFRSATTFATYFIVLSMANGPADRRRVWWAVMIGLLAESLVTFQYGRNGPAGRAIGSIGQANELGTYLSMFGVAALAGLFGVRRWFGRLLILVTFVYAAIGIMMSLSRGGMLALVLGALLVTWRTSRVLFMVVIAALLLSPIWVPPYVQDRIMNSQVEVEGSDEVALDNSAETRLETWQSIIDVVSRHPLDGVGFTGLGYVLPDVGSSLGLEVADSAHNTFLRVLAELGVLGLALFLWLLAKVMMLANLAVRTGRTAFDRAIGVGLQGATVALAVSCWFGDRFFNVVIASGFWVLCALAEDVVAEARQPS